LLKLFLHKNKSERKNTEPFMKIYSFFKALLYRRVDSKTKHKTSFGVYGTFWKANDLIKNFLGGRWGAWR